MMGFLSVPIWYIRTLVLQNILARIIYPYMCFCRFLSRYYFLTYPHPAHGSKFPKKLISIHNSVWFDSINFIFLSNSAIYTSSVPSRMSGVYLQLCGFPRTLYASWLTHYTTPSRRIPSSQPGWQFTHDGSTTNLSAIRFCLYGILSAHQIHFMEPSVWFSSSQFRIKIPIVYRVISTKVVRLLRLHFFLVFNTVRFQDIL